MTGALVGAGAHGADVNALVPAQASLVASVLRLAPLALKRAPGLPDGASLPALEERAQVRVDAAWLRAYRTLVGAVDDGLLPPCAPQVLAVGLHMRLLANPLYPLPVLGTVHMRNVIDEDHGIPAGATLRLRAALAAERRTERGIEVDIVTEARLEEHDGPAPWRSTMTALVRSSRGGRKEGAGARSQREEGVAGQPLLSSSVVRAGADLGRRYARVAGDANPIHLAAWAARPFGFPRAIAHGMCTLQRALSEVADALPPSPRRVEARFIKPVLLPGAYVVEQQAVTGAGRAAVAVRPLKPGAPHVLIDVHARG